MQMYCSINVSTDRIGTGDTFDKHRSKMLNVLFEKGNVLRPSISSSTLHIINSTICNDHAKNRLCNDHAKNHFAIATISAPCQYKGSPA